MNPKKLCNILLNNFLGILNKHKVTVSDCGIPSEDFYTLAQLLYTGAIDRKMFTDIIEKRIESYKYEQRS